ncbi:hypothetical protein D1872_257860 [compost metagenome]
MFAQILQNIRGLRLSFRHSRRNGLRVGRIHIVDQQTVDDNLAVLLIGRIETAQHQLAVPGLIVISQIAESGGKIPVDIGVGAVFFTDMGQRVIV